MLTEGFHVIDIFTYCCRKVREMPGNSLKLSGKVREKSGILFCLACGTLNTVPGLRSVNPQLCN